ncbi:hypothetical protein YC2023_018360 [Brassica napus]
MDLEPALASVYRVHLAQNRDVVLNLRPLFVQAIIPRSASFQTLPFGLINVDSDYFMLVVVTYSGMHLMISNGSPVVDQVSLVNFVIFCYAVLSCFMVFIKPSRISPISYSDPNRNPIPETTNDTNSTEAVQQFKLYHALIFSIPICFTFIVLFVFYVIYLRRRSSSVDWSSLGMRGGGSFVSTNNLSKIIGGFIKMLSTLFILTLIFDEFSSVTFGPNEYGQAELGLSKELRGMLPIVIFKESYSINDSHESSDQHCNTRTVHIQHRPSHSGSVSCSLAKRTETGPVLRKTDFDGSSETGSAHKASNGVGAYRWLNRFLATDAGK